MAQTVPSQFLLIRKAAELALSGKHEQVKDYASAITRCFLSEGPIKDSLDERVTTLHMKYLAGEAPAVSEQTLVSALNQVASQMSLPEYGKTSPIEFRLFRMAVLRALPELNPAPAPAPDRGPETKMSPVEIAYLIGLLLLQKRINPSFQVTEAELQQRSAEHHDIPQRTTLAITAGPARSGAVVSAFLSFSKTLTLARLNGLFNFFAEALGYREPTVPR
ncbi:MAG: hypothetical protein JO340_07230 [Acidobacteriaceae bacterium]|nr:hypothetical protein [Acidobacteriaceae bacterium]